MEIQNTTNQNDVSGDVFIAETAVNTDKKKILVIDDDENLTSVLVDKLNFSGFDADFSNDSKAGLEKAIETKPDAILLDVKMPNMSGWEILEKLRIDPWGETAKVIMLTAIDQAESIAHAMEEGSTVFIVKTNYTLDQVVEKVKEVLHVK